METNGKGLRPTTDLQRLTRSRPVCPYLVDTEHCASGGAVTEVKVCRGREEVVATAAPASDVS